MDTPTVSNKSGDVSFANIYTLAFKCSHFSSHGESWPWCFLFIIYLHCNSSTIELVVSQSQCSHIPPLFILLNDYVPFALCYHHFSSSLEVTIKSSPLLKPSGNRLWHHWIWRILVPIACRKATHHIRVVITSQQEKPCAVPVCLFFCIEYSATLLQKQSVP